MPPPAPLLYRHARIMPVLSKQLAFDLVILILHSFFSYYQTLVVLSLDWETKVESAGFKSMEIMESV